MTHSLRTSPSATFGAVAIAAGAVVAVLLGVYGATHTPTGEVVTTFGFGSLIAMKVWLGLAVGALALVQLVTASWMYGRFGDAAAPSYVPVVHRVSGALAVVVSLPVAFHCLWSLGFQSYDTRTLVHSLVGCLFYGALVTKLLVLHGPSTSGWVLPAVGGTLFTALVLVVLTSAVWYLSTAGVPAGGGY